MNQGADPADDVLLQLPWLPVTIDGCQLLAKSWFGETAYRILLTDMACVWEERMDAPAIQSRAQELNRRLRASVGAFFSHLRDVAQPCLSGSDAEARISMSRQEDPDVTLRLKSELAGLPFYWEFHCSPAPVALVCVQLVRPLLLMSRLLQRQVDNLGELLVRKDEEIQDYQENGATLSRERLQTDIFDKQLYTEDFIQQTLPLLWSEPSDALGFDADLRHLYAATVAHGGTRKRQRPEETANERDRASPEPPSQSLPQGVGGDPARDRNQNSGEQVKPPDTKNSSGAAAQTKLSALATTRPAEQPTSKPKKKKVGLFR